MSFSFFYAKCLFDVIQSKIHLLKEIIAQEDPERIIVFESTHSLNQQYVAFSESDSVYSQLLKLSGWKIPVIHIPLNEHFQIPASRELPLPTHTIMEDIRKILIKNSFFFNNGMIVKKKGLRYLLHITYYSIIERKKRPIILFGSGYNWDDALLELYRAGFHPIIRYLNTDCNVNKPEDGKQIRNDILRLFNSNNFIKKASIMYGINTSSLLFEKLSIILSNSIIESEYAYQHFSNLIQEKKPDCVLISTQVHPVDQAFIQAAHDNETTVISWQHGGAGYCYHPLMPFAEFIGSDVHLVFGNAVKVSYISTSLKLGIGTTPQIIEVGSSTLDSERVTIARDSLTPPEKGPIIYVTEKFLNNFYYISTSYDATRVNDIFWLAQKKILQVARQNPSNIFIFKLHPSDLQGEPIRSYVKDNQINNVRFVVREQSVKELFQIAQIIIIDFIATVVLEALLTNKPVFVYSGTYKIDEYPLNLLKKRAYVFDDLDDLIRGVEEYLSKNSSDFLKKWNVNNNNTEFLKEYGTFKNDGNSAKRAVEIVKGIVKAN